MDFQGHTGFHLAYEVDPLTLVVTLTIKDRTDSNVIGDIVIEPHKIRPFFEALREIEKAIAPKSPPEIISDYLTPGAVYQILAKGDFNWESVGSPSSSEGGKFVASSVGPLTGGAIAGSIANWQYRLRFDKKTNKAAVEFTTL